jgi:hypothetical protein
MKNDIIVTVVIIVFLRFILVVPPNFILSTRGSRPASLMMFFYELQVTSANISNLILPLYKYVEIIYHLVIISNILSLMVIIYNNFLYTIALFMLHHLLINHMRRLT